MSRNDEDCPFSGLGSAIALEGNLSIEEQDGEVSKREGHGLTSDRPAAAGRSRVLGWKPLVRGPVGIIRKQSVAYQYVSKIFVRRHWQWEVVDEIARI